MAFLLEDKMENQEGQEIKGEDFGQKIPPEVIEPQPPTAEEQLATLQEQYAKEKQELLTRFEQADKEARSAQAAVTREQQKSKANVDLIKRMDGFESTLEIVAGRIIQGDLSPEDAQAFRNEVAAAKESTRKEIEDANQKTILEEQLRKNDELWVRAQKFGTYDDNDSVAEIFDALIDGKSRKAERIIKKLEGTPKDTKVESEEDLKKKWIEEGKRLALEESGGLNSESGLPSGSMKKDERIREAYRKNPYGNKEFAEMQELVARGG